MSIPLLDTPARTPRDLAGWMHALLRTEIPVLRETAVALEELRECEDAVDARIIGETVAADPLMTLKVLACASSLGSERRVTDAETVTEALVLIGITPFFRLFGPQPSIEDHLHSHPDALAGLRAVLRRSRRAARFALSFAVHRLDHDAQVIHDAALLHDFAELLLWLHAPALALEIQRRQSVDAGLRSNAIQRELLHAELADVGHALMQAWRLPPLLLRISDDRHADAPPVRNVLLAIRLARHSAHGWDNPALPDDVNEIAALLNMREEPTWHLLREIDPL